MFKLFEKIKQCHMALVGWSRLAFGDIKGPFGWRSGKLGR